VPLLGKMTTTEVYFNNNKYSKKAHIFSWDDPKQDTDTGFLYAVGKKSEANYTGRPQFYKMIFFMNYKYSNCRFS
jgi:hypothetical protein